MLNEVTCIVFTLLAIYLLLISALPEFFLPNLKGKPKKFGGTDWGFYEGRDAQEPEENRTIQVGSPARKHKLTAGSTMYQQGRGTSFRQ